MFVSFNNVTIDALIYDGMIMYVGINGWGSRWPRYFFTCTHDVTCLFIEDIVWSSFTVVEG